MTADDACALLVEAIADLRAARIEAEAWRELATTAIAALAAALNDRDRQHARTVELIDEMRRYVRRVVSEVAA